MSDLTESANSCVEDDPNYPKWTVNCEHEVTEWDW